MNLSITGCLSLTLLPGSITDPVSDAEIDALAYDGLARRLLHNADNLVVNIGREIVTKMLGSARGTTVTVDGTSVSDVDDLQIAVIKLGNKVSPAAPAAGDTALDDVDPVFTTTSVTVTYPSATQVRLSAVLPADQIVGEAVTEEGLFISIPPTPTEKLFAKLTFAAKVIQPSQAYQIDHTINVAAT